MLAIVFGTIDVKIVAVLANESNQVVALWKRVKSAIKPLDDTANVEW